MKTKAKTILLILLLASVLLFSGCDAVLEAFYPEFADVSEEITATVEVSTYDFYDFYSYSPLSIAIIPFEDRGYGLEPIWEDMELKIFTSYNEGMWIGSDPYNSQYDFYQFTEVFSVPTEKEYIIVAWHDMNESGKPESGESATVLPVFFEDSYYDTGDQIFYLDSESGTGDAYSYLASGDRLPWEIETMLFGYY